VFRGDFHLDKAIEAALAVRKSIAQMPSQAEHISFFPKVSIGVNSGEMVSGNIGSVTLRRLDYTVIGDVVNTAQRLQAAGKESQIIISETSYEKIKDSFNCNKVGEVTLKNKANLVTIYEVLD